MQTTEIVLLGNKILKLQALTNTHKNTWIFVGWFTTSDLRHSNNNIFLSTCLLVKWMLICMYNFIWFTQSSFNIHSKFHSLRAHLCSTKLRVCDLFPIWTHDCFFCNLKSIKCGFSTHFGHTLRSQNEKISLTKLNFSMPRLALWACNTSNLFTPCSKTRWRWWYKHTHKVSINQLTSGVGSLKLKMIE